jgi:hypothetical protein
MRVEKREFAWKFSQLSCPGQTRTRVAWELMRVDEICEARVCMRVFSIFVPWSNENKSCMRVGESWEARVCVRVFSTFMPRSNENKSCMRVDENWQDITTHVAKPLINIWTSSKLMRVDENWRSNWRRRIGTLINYSRQFPSSIDHRVLSGAISQKTRQFGTFSYQNRAWPETSSCETIIEKRLLVCWQKGGGGDKVHQ